VGQDRMGATPGHWTGQDNRSIGEEWVQNGQDMWA